MPIKQITQGTPLVKEGVSSANAPSNFTGRQVRAGKQQEDTTDVESYMHDGDKSIHDRLASTSVNDSSSVALDDQSETDSFYSAVDFLSDRLSVADDVFFESTTVAEDSQTNSTDCHQAVTVNQETIKNLEEADCERLNQYIKDFTEVYEGTDGAEGIATDISRGRYMRW